MLKYRCPICGEKPHWSAWFDMYVCSNCSWEGQAEANNLIYDRQIAYQALVGSHNYNLNDINSDYDYKLFIIPTFDDLYGNKLFAKQIVTNDVDYEVHDIRKLPQLLMKSNINYMETLFSIERQAYHETMEGILLRRDELARINLPYLFNACMGMYRNKFNLLTKGTKGTQFLVDKYGYDTKQAVHCYRCLDFLERYHANGFTSFKNAIWYEDESSAKNTFHTIKNGFLTLERFEKFAKEKEGFILKLEDEYKKHEVNQNLYKWLEKQVKLLIKDSLAS